MNPRSSLLSIIAHARSGALDHAWRLFRDAGLDDIDDDPAVLSVRGRLLKDRALAASGAEQRRFYLEAAEAYARAGEIGGATYPLINAATLSLLAGRRVQADALARQVLDRALREDDEPETPYYRAATRAEALLVVGDITRARGAIAEAIARAPEAYEDHASTLRQFGHILDALGEDKTWLDVWRPPRALHFAGLMGISAEGDMIGRRIRSVIREERIGYGYGALAAGADILIAEALLEAKAELHLVLPTERERFREASVARYGGTWGTRFDQILEAADSVRFLGGVSDPLSTMALQLAAEIAMGRAAMQADVLMTEAVQLLIIDRNAPAKRVAGGSNWVGAAWEKSGRRQHVLTAPRVEPAEAPVAPKRVVQNFLTAMLRIEFSVMDAETLGEETLPTVAAALATGPAAFMPPRWIGEAVLVAFDSASSAASAALAVADALKDMAGVRIAGHYAVTRRLYDPFGGDPLLTGPAATVLGKIIQSAPSGATHVTEDFAAALYAESSLERPRLEYVGELPVDIADEDAMRLFSLKP